MKWYQPIECDNTVADPLVCDDDNFEKFGFAEDDFKKGLVIENWNSEIFVRVKEPENSGEPDDVLQTHLMIPIFSDKLVRVLNLANINNIQYLPIKVYDLNDKLYPGFCIANFTKKIAAFDFEKSIYNFFSEDFPNPNVRGKLAGVRKFVLKENKLTGLDAIRLEEYKQRFFVSEKFKDVFQKNNFTGYSFIEVNLT